MSTTTIPLKKRDASILPPTSNFMRNGGTGQPHISSTSMGTFTGQVWLDLMLKEGDLTIANVNFEPCARTNWHRHEGGQLLKVTAGSGWVCDQGSQPRKIGSGDIIWLPPGGIHWHGADDGSCMVHEAISWGGIDWYEAVSEEDYKSKVK